MKRLALLLVLFCNAFVMLAQTDSLDTEEKTREQKLPYKTNVKYADKLFEIGNYFEAMSEYLKLQAKKPNNAHVNFMIGECYLLARDYKQAEEIYKGVIEKDASSEDLLYYRYGTALQHNGKYTEAKAAFEQFVGSQADNKKLESELRHAQLQVDACEYAKQATAEKTTHKVTHLDPPVNKNKTENGPRIYDENTMYFSSLNDNMLLNAKFAQGNGPLLHIYKATKTSTGWGNVDIIPAPINSGEAHTGNVAFSADGNRMYYTICKGNGVNEISCDIYVAKKAGDSWGEPIKLGGGVNKDSDDTHPAVGGTENGKDVLYFTSNRDGGAGGYDIYTALVDKDGGVSSVKAVSGSVNTEWDERTPYYWEKNSTLFFSSNGHIGFGGFDNYYATKDSEGKFTEVSNLGYPQNSGADDMGYAVGEDNLRTFYLVSNRPGIIGDKSETCCDDIFKSYNTFEPVITVKGDVIQREDSTTTRPLEGVRVELYDITDGTPKLVDSDSLTGSAYDFRLEPNKKYSIKYTKANHFPQYREISTEWTPENVTKVDDVTLDMIIKNKSYVISKVYYEYKSAKLTEESKAALDTLYMLLNENPELVVELSSHTDSIGSESYNVDLSQDRAASCVEYLLSKGIDKDRLIPKGYGETKPVAPNSKNGKDNPDGRALNRRTEYKIIGELKRKGDKLIIEE